MTSDYTYLRLTHHLKDLANDWWGRVEADRRAKSRLVTDCTGLEKPRWLEDGLGRISAFPGDFRKHQGFKAPSVIAQRQGVRAPEWMVPDVRTHRGKQLREELDVLKRPRPLDLTYQITGQRTDLFFCRDIYGRSVVMGPEYYRLKGLWYALIPARELRLDKQGKEGSKTVRIKHPDAVRIESWQFDRAWARAKLASKGPGSKGKKKKAKTRSKKSRAV